MRRAPEGRRPVRVRAGRRGSGRPARRGRAVRSGPRHHVGDRRACLRRHPADAAPLVDLVHRGHRPRGSVGRAKAARSTGTRSARVGGTIVVLMGVARIGQIAERLAGERPRRGHACRGHHVGHATRAANGAGDAGDDRASQRSNRRRRSSSAKWPRSISRGSRRRPLFGRRIVVTRAREQASELTRPARGAGCRGHRAAGDRDRGSGRRRCSAFARPRRRPQLRLVGAHVCERRAAVFSQSCTTRRDLGGVKVAAIGPGTAEALRQGNVRR